MRQQIEQWQKWILAAFVCVLIPNGAYALIHDDQMDPQAPFSLRGDTVIVTGATTDMAFRPITPFEAGMVYVLPDTDRTGIYTFTLPDSDAGVHYWFVDLDDEPGVDLTNQAAADETINGGMAGKKYVATGDTATGDTTHLYNVDGTNWIVLGANTGTWTNDNS